MPGFVTCPNCSEELDIPAALRGKAVRCAACAKSFTVPPDDAPPSPPRAARVEPRDDPRDSGADDFEPRPRRRSFDRPPPRRRSNAWLWLLLFGSLGTCCVGCGGFLVFAVSFADPDLTDYAAPDGRFATAFPGPVAVDTKPQPKGGTVGATTSYEHRRTIFGQVFDNYFVRAIELRDDPDDRKVEKAVAQVVDELVAGGVEVKRGRASLGTYDATEVMVSYRDGPQEQVLVARVAAVGDRIYVVGIRGQSLTKPDEQLRLREFWDRFSAKGGE